VYLLDTNVISEARKGSKAHAGVIAFRARVLNQEDFIPAQVVGELRRGVENLKHRGDLPQATLLESWLESILDEYAERVLSFNAEAAHIWGRLMSPNDQNPIDKQIAAIALLYDLTVISRNEEHFAATGVRVLNPFQAAGAPDRDNQR
jgi:predicted nucleic acid-binding protein